MTSKKKGVQTNMVERIKGHVRNEQMVQLPLDGFMEPAQSVLGGRVMELIAMGKIVWTMLCDPLGKRGPHHTFIDAKRGFRLTNNFEEALTARRRYSQYG